MTIDEYSQKLHGIRFYILDEFEARELIRGYNHIHNGTYAMIDYWTARETRNGTYDPYDK